MDTAIHGFRVVAALALATWIVPAFAAVTLTTMAQKVEYVKAADGTISSQLVAADKVVPGDEVKYTIIFKNDANVPVEAGTVVVTNPLPENTVYVADSASGSGTKIQFSTDRAMSFGSPDDLTVVREGTKVPATSADYTTIQWTFGPALAPAAQSHVSFNVRLK